MNFEKCNLTNFEICNLTNFESKRLLCHSIAIIFFIFFFCLVRQSEKQKKSLILHLNELIFFILKNLTYVKRKLFLHRKYTIGQNHSKSIIKLT